MTSKTAEEIYHAMNAASLKHPAMAENSWAELWHGDVGLSYHAEQIAIIRSAMDDAIQAERERCELAIKNAVEPGERAPMDVFIRAIRGRDKR